MARKQGKKPRPSRTQSVGVGTQMARIVGGGLLLWLLGSATMMFVDYEQHHGVYADLAEGGLGVETQRAAAPAPNLRTQAPVAAGPRPPAAPAQAAPPAQPAAAAAPPAPPAAQAAAAPAADPADPNEPDIHVIFSTDCSPFQNWQSIVVYYSALAVGQPGPLTRIASGCSDSDKADIIAMHKQLPSKFRVHFTPDFTKDPITGKTYYFYNKPYGLLHWLENAHVSESIVALIDPDMLFLKPLTGEYPPDSYLTSSPWKDGEVWPRVVKGKPAGQQYGLGAGWRKFNREYICGEGSPCVTTSAQEANKYFPVGPPYIAHVDDLKILAKTWTAFVPKIFEEYPNLLAEMYAYCMAAAHLGLKHARIDNHMVSNVGAGGEGWPWVDKMDDACADVDAYGGDLPTVVHYCQNYRQADWMFAKRRMPRGSVGWPVPDGILACETPLLAVPPSANQNVEWYQNPDGSRKDLSMRQAKRTGFMLCTITRKINAALTAFKTQVCPPGTANFTQGYRMESAEAEKKRLKAEKAEKAAKAKAGR